MPRFLKTRCIHVSSLIGAYGFLLAALAYRVFYIQELFFAFLLFAIAFLLLLLLVVAVFCALYVYARGMTYLALRISAQGIALCRSFACWCSGLPPRPQKLLKPCRSHSAFCFIRSMAYSKDGPSLSAGMSRNSATTPSSR